MDSRIDELTVKLDQLHAKNDAMHIIVPLLLTLEDKRSPLVLKHLKRLAAGDVPEMVPDLSVILSYFNPAQRAR